MSAPVESGDFVVQSWVTSDLPRRRLIVRDKATLATAWTATLLGDVDLGFPGPAPAVVDGQIYLGDGNTLYSFPLVGCGAATCEPTWTLDLGSHPTTVAAAPGGDSVYVIREMDLAAVDRASGTIAWTSELGGGGATGLAITDDWVYVANGSALATFPPAGCGAATCQPSASGTLDANATSAPVVAGDVIYVGITGGVQVIDATTGPLMPIVTLPLSGSSPTSIVVDGGRLFVVAAQAAPLPSRLIVYIPLGVPPGPDGG